MASIMDGVDQKTRLVGRNRLELLTFRLGTSQRFGINVFKVREVIKCPPLTRMPHANPVICGISNMRGMTIPVIDLAYAVGKSPLDRSGETFVVVSEYNRAVQGFLVSSVERIVNLNWEAIKAPPKGMGGSTFLTAVTRIDGELVEIIDVEKIMAEVMGLDLHVSEDVTRDKDYSKQRHFVLVVDDSAMARKQIVRVLDQLDIEYETATNGREAYDLLTEWARNNPEKLASLDLLISDIEMPEMDGYTLTKQVKESAQLKDLYVMLHTSLSGVFNESLVKKVGADDYLSKFRPDELAERVVKRMTERSGGAQTTAAA
jgi:two-component system chemotaxis response regulator CheV